MSYLQRVTNTDRPWSETNARLLVVGIFENQSLTSLGQEIDLHLGGVIKKAASLGDLTGKPGESRTFYDDDHVFLVMGLGPRDQFNSEAIRKAGGSISKVALASKITTLAVECFCACSEKSE